MTLIGIPKPGPPATQGAVSGESPEVPAAEGTTAVHPSAPRVDHANHYPPSWRLGSRVGCTVTRPSSKKVHHFPTADRHEVGGHGELLVFDGAELMSVFAPGSWAHLEWYRDIDEGEYEELESRVRAARSTGVIQVVVQRRHLPASGGPVELAAVPDPDDDLTSSVRLADIGDAEVGGLDG